MAETTQAEETAAAAPGPKDRREAARLARQITAFARSHGGGAQGQLAHIGRGTTRIALVGTDGQWGNLVARSHAAAGEAVRLAGIELRDDFDGEMAAKVRTGPYEWSRMAGLQIGGPANPPAQQPPADN
ncbi:hypothetical protein GCM10010218_55510 [Streptomyces mashuensis]|uniref:Uncharacterized protein n=1 Tax=Streptomyces mashuensis TaxID=33904 RepID=A0A919B9H2_9ACTN|nr:hypothetical protein [Streptomyces mashuensis]GHF66790.1 hypothetical protein GCM10010218_55510 [Streptomyces mashuensis]